LLKGDIQTVFPAQGGSLGIFLSWPRHIPRLKDMAKNIAPHVFPVGPGTVEVVVARIGNSPQW